MQGDELSSGGDSDHTDSERSLGSLDNHCKHSIMPASLPNLIVGNHASR